MYKVILDASFVISLIDNSDSKYEEAIRIASVIDLDTTVFYINEIIYAEICTVLARKNLLFLCDPLEQFLEIYTIKYISFDRSYISVWNTLKERISVQDISLFVDAKNYGAKILTFDQQVLKLERTLVL